MPPAGSDDAYDGSDEAGAEAGLLAGKADLLCHGAGHAAGHRGVG